MSKLTLSDVGNLVDGPTAQGIINSNSTLIETALENTLSRDGTAPNAMNAALDMNSNQIYNLPAPSSVNSPARLIDVVSNPTITIPGTGTSGHVVPYLDQNNTWSGTNAFNSGITSTTVAASGNATVGGTLGVTGVATFTAAPVVPNSSFSNAKLANMAANTIKGNNTGGAAAPIDLTATQTTAMLDVATGSLKGLMPAFSGTTTTFLRGDGTWNAPPGTQQVLLGTYTASTSANLSDFSVFTSTYKHYEIVFDNLIPTTNGAGPVFQMYSGSLRTSGYLNTPLAIISGGASGVVADTASIAIGYDHSATNTSANPRNGAPGITGKLFLINPSDAATVKLVTGSINYLQANNTHLAQISINGCWNTAGAITGFQFAFQTGNISSGNIKIYGII